MMMVVCGCVGKLGDPLDSKLKGSGGTDDPPATGEHAPKDVNRPTLHRLNRTEYNNTVRDLLGTKLQPALEFPADDVGFGFDNNADVLTVSPLWFELVDRASETLVEEVMHQSNVQPKSELFEGESLTSEVGQATADAWLLWTEGELPVSVNFASSGTYRISVRMWGQQAGPDAVKAEIRVGAKVIGSYDIASTVDNPQTIDVEVEVSQGNQVVSVSFLNDFYDADTKQDRNLMVDWIKVEGPLGVSAGSNPLRDRIVTCDPVANGTTCQRTILEQFAKKAWRRPVSSQEVDRLQAFVTLAEKEGDDVNEGLKLALRSILDSPHFLYRVEIDENPSSTEPHVLSQYEIASRLSYFLWSSMPDEALFTAAEQEKLYDPKELRSQVHRMLADKKAEAFVENFVGQWLFTRALSDHEPDTIVYPTFDQQLRKDMQNETLTFVKDLIFNNQDFRLLLTADYSFLNQRLAEHYGVQGVQGEELVKTPLSGTKRQGLLTQGSVLTVTSYPRRTSIVKRGKWVLTQLLCNPPADPPPNVEAITDKATATGSLREIMEAHRADPVCASCHKVMDPLGFGLENYDGVGKWRTEENGFSLDSRGELPDKTQFEGALELSEILSNDARFPRCVAQHTLTYALGRGPGAGDQAYLDEITKHFAERGYMFGDLVTAIVTSEPFLMRRGETSTNGGQP
jgi:hypothetical protein